MNDITGAFPTVSAGLIKRIRTSTNRLNPDNVSRTRAYQAFWPRHPPPRRFSQMLDAPKVSQESSTPRS